MPAPKPKSTIFPEISGDAQALLMRTCEVQGCSPGAVVEAALYALLQPREAADRDAVLIQGVIRLREDVAAMLALHKQMLALLEAQGQPAAVRVATFADMYTAKEPGTEAQGAIGGFQPSVEEAVQPGGWGRLFPKRENR